MKVLVTGGAGYIGGILVDELKKSHTVHVLDALVYETRYMKDVTFFNEDIRNTSTLKAIIEREKYDVVVWCAAIVGDPACAANPRLTNQVNFESIKNLIDVCTLPHFVFFSTCSVYGAQDGILDEDSKTSPLSTYAVTKLMAEKVVQTLPSYTILRLGTVFGVGDEHSRLRLDLVVNVMTLNALRGGHLSVMGGQQWRPIIAARDVAKYAAEAATKKIQGTYVLSCENVTIAEMGKRVANALPGIEVWEKPMKKEDERNYRVDRSRSEKAFEHAAYIKIEDEVPRIAKVLTSKRVVDVGDTTYNNAKHVRTQAFKNRFVEQEPFVFDMKFHADDRGLLQFCNELNLADIKRFYVVNHVEPFIRAWHGHRKEAKFVYVLSGFVQMGLVDMKTHELKWFYLSAEKPQVLYIPPGFYNGFKNLSQKCSIMFLSTSTTEESQGDDIRLDWNAFGSWDIKSYR